MKEYIVGRAPSSVIAVPADKNGVSGEHVRISISDSGKWEVEDLGSANGTFFKDENGVYQRVYKKVIDENTMLRLGQEGHNSFIFMAHRVVAPDSSYNYEFKQLRKILKKQIEEEDALETRNARNMQIVKLAAPIALVFCVVAQFTIPGLKDDANLNLWISRGAMAIAPVVIGMFFGIDTRKVKALKQKRLRMLTCPKCGYPISETDVHQMACSRCKAK